MTLEQLQKDKDKRLAQKRASQLAESTNSCDLMRGKPRQVTSVSLAVMDFYVGQAGSPEQGVALADLCRGIVQKSGIWVLLDREHIIEILGEQDFASAVSCDRTKCVVEYGKLLSAQKMLCGRISVLGSTYVVRVSVTDVETGRVHDSETRQVDSDWDALGQIVGEMCCDVLKKCL